MNGVLNPVVRKLTGEGRQYEYFHQDNVKTHSADKAMAAALVFESRISINDLWPP
jgi:hypothetical protein